MKDKLSKVGRIKQARQERAGMFLAAAEQRLRDAQRQQENIDALAQDYASRVDSQENTPMATAADLDLRTEEVRMTPSSRITLIPSM